MRKAVLQTHRHHCAGCSCRWAAEHRPCSGLLSSHRSGLWLHTGHRWEDDASHLSVRCRTYSGPDSYEQKETVIKGMSSIEIGSHAKKWQQQPFVYLTGKSTMSLILSLQIKLLKENRLSWMMRTLGKRHSNSCLEASRCCWHFGQYLKNRVFENSLYQVKQRHQVNSWFRRKKNDYHASSGASTSGLVKRLRHCSRVKCPALAVSLREPWSSSYSSSLELTRTYSLRRSLFFHTSARVVSSGSSVSKSSKKKERKMKRPFSDRVNSICVAVQWTS